MAMTMTHIFILPYNQTDHRCFGCGASYVSYDGGSTVIGSHQAQQEIVYLSADGFYYCHWCPDRKFRWGR